MSPEAIKTQAAKAQPALCNYALHSLGWKAFQNLCVTLVAEIWGQQVQGFFDSHDGGRDGAFHGTWTDKDGTCFDGSFTVQCKFTAKADKQIKLTDIKDELSKASRLASRGLSDNYFLFTNVQLTGINDEKIRTAFESVPGIKRCRTYGCERISQIIHESNRLRMLVPRLYGLGDLSQIFDERAYAQAEEILSAMGDDLSKFVITDPFKKSAKALIEHGFVLLLGAAACGKSTIAAALAVGALDQWGCSTMKVCDADEFVKHSNPHEPKQFFWIDDAFGSTQFDWARVTAWNKVFPHMLAAIHRGAKVLFTSRDYIYRNARQHLKESAFPIIKEAQVVINVQDLITEEREQILYNHIKLGAQPKEFKNRLKPFLPCVASNHDFIPEIARRLGNPFFTKKLQISNTALNQFVSEPVDLLKEIIQTLDANSRSALALVFMRSGLVTSPVEISTEEQKAISRLGGTESGVIEAINALNESLLLRSYSDGQYVVRFKHPTIRDAFAALIAENTELLDIYLAGTPIETVFSEVTCGDMAIDGVKVIIPVDRYDSLLARIDAFENSGNNNRAIHIFLAHRCDKDFLKRYTARHPYFITGLRAGAYLFAVSDVDVIVRLYEFGLLPEEKREQFFVAVKQFAVDIPDAGFLIPRIRQLFKREELGEILKNVRVSLIPFLEDLVSDWRTDYSCDRDPEEHFCELISALQDYRNEFIEYEEDIELIDNALEQINDEISQIRDREPDEIDDDYDWGNSKTITSSPRSIFDDVDL